MRILVIHNNLGLGGIETQMLHYFPMLRKKKVDVDVCLVRGADAPNILQELLQYAHVYQKVVGGLASASDDTLSRLL